MKSPPLLWILALVVLVNSAKERQIGERSVLLPIDYGVTHRVQHLMEAYGGCYVWTTNEPLVLRVLDLNGNSDCEGRALIEVQKEGPFSGPLSVSATDKSTGQVIKAVVRLSKLHRIQILTKFRIMNLYQVQEFYLIGYDELGNSFSSLEGLKFQWTFQQAGRVGQRISIKESNIFQETNYRRSLQDIGYETDMLVLKALNIGEIKLTVRLNQPNYEHISTSIVLSVQERFDISPHSPVYMLAGSKLRFHLMNAKGQKIPLPASYYHYSAGDGFKVTNDLLVSTPSYEAETRLVIEDTRTRPAYSNQVEIVSLNADGIQVIAKSYVIVGESQPFKIQLYNNRRPLKGNAQIELDSDFYLNIQNSSFTASSKTTGIIRAEYNGLSHEKRIVANLKIMPILIRDKIVLPPGQTFELKVLGGSGSFDYQLKDSSNIAYIDYNGVIKSRNPGKAKVVVTDNNNYNNRVEIDLIIEEVKTIRSFDQKLEAGTADETTLLAIVQPQHQRQYTQCNEIPISTFESDLFHTVGTKDVTLDVISKIHEDARTSPQLSNVLDIFRQGRDLNLNKYRDYIAGNEITLSELQKVLFLQDNFGICKAIRIKPDVARDGDVRFRIDNMQQKDYSTVPFKLKIYDELSLVDQVSNRVLIVPGSSFIWKPTHSSYQDSMSFLNGVRTNEGESIIVTCSQPGEIRQYDVKLVTSISQKIPRPYTRSIKLTLECLQPSSLKFKINKYIVENGHLSTVNDEPFVVQLRGFDHLGRQFYNISSLDLDWQTIGLKKSDVSQQDNTYKFEFKGKEQAPRVSVRTSGSRYHGFSFPEIQTSLDIVKAKGFSLSMKGRQIKGSLTLVATPNSKHVLKILDGSSNFQVRCPNPDLLVCSLNSLQNIVQITPLKKGNTKIIITDVQQYGRPSIQVNVKIVNPVRLRIHSNSSLVEEGSSFKLSYSVYGQDDVLIDDFQHSFLNIVPSYTCALERTDSNTFKALRKGLCSISARMDGYRLSSENAVQIQVFPKFSINLRNVVQGERQGIKYYTAEARIPIGCNSSLVFLGGPFGVGKLSYQIQPSNLLTIEELNLRTFRIIGRKKGTGELKFTLKDGQRAISVVDIKVVVNNVNGVQLFNNGNRQIHQRATVRFIPQLTIDGESVISSKCPIRYKWRTDNQDVVRIQGWNSKEASENVGLNVTGIRKGLAKIQMTPVYQGNDFSSQQFIVQVIETPVVELSTYIHHRKVNPTSLLVPPNSGYAINSSYHVEVVSPSEKLIRITGNDIQTFNDKGGSVIKIRTTQQDHSETYMSVHIEKIHSIFIQDPLSKLSLQIDTEVRIPFYVQDSFGRLFPNKLKNIDYQVRVSNPLVVSAQLSQDRQYIILRGFTSGLTDLYLSIQGSPDIYDVVPIQTMILIYPTSPVSVHVGGSVEFQSVKGAFGEWSSDNPFIMQIDKRTGKALALREGSTQISYDLGIEYKSRVNVFKAVNIILKDSTQVLSNFRREQQPLPLIVYADNGNGLTELKHLNRPLHSINNNLVVKCVPKQPVWFQITCSIQSLNDNEQIIVAYPKTVKVYPNEEMPNHLEFQVTLESQTTGEQILTRDITYPFHFQFRIPRQHQYITLNSRNPSKTIEIQTNSKLGVYSEYSKTDFMATEFIPQRSVQIIKLDLKNEDDPVRASVKVINPATKQSEQIVFNYNPSGTSTPSSGILQWLGLRWSWTGWVIALMIGVLATLFICACCNRDIVLYGGKDD